jgi:hypothetical protein
VNTSVGSSFLASGTVVVSDPAATRSCKDRSISHGLPLDFFSGDTSLPSAFIIIAAGSTLGSLSSGISPFYLNLNTRVLSFSFDGTVLVSEPAFYLSLIDVSIIHGVFYNFNTSASFSAAAFAKASFGSFRASANLGYPPFILSLNVISSVFLSLFTTTFVIDPPLSLSYSYLSIGSTLGFSSSITLPEASVLPSAIATAFLASSDILTGSPAVRRVKKNFPCLEFLSATVYVMFPAFLRMPIDVSIGSSSL